MKLLLFCARFSLLGFLATGWVGAADPVRPNILLIVGDDMGYADIGVQGATDIQTPHIDSLARHGVRFTSGYVSGPYCSPTRAALLTGRYQQRYGHEFNPGPAQRAGEDVGLPLTEKTLADHLKAAGYATGVVGKWHLGYHPQFHPQRRGFEHFFGFLGGAHSYLDANADSANPILRGTEPVDEPEYLTDAFRREAVAFVERYQEGPWFLFLSFNAVHTPMHATAPYLDRYQHIAEERRRTYAAMMAAMDDAVGAVLEKLRDLDLEEQTLIFFISDNGGPPVNGSSNAPLRGYKAQTWEGGIRVPFLVQWKGRLPAGTTYDQPVIQLDVLPTALTAAGVEVKPEWKIDGVDLLPFLTGEKKGPPHQALYWRFGPQMAIRMGDWKLVKASERGAAILEGSSDLGGAQLFNLATDMGEKNNLAAREPDQVKRLKAAWMEWNSGLEEPRWIPRRGAARRRQ